MRLIIVAAVLALGCSNSQSTRVLVQEVAREGSEPGTQIWNIADLPKYGRMSDAGGGLIKFSWMQDADDHGEVVFRCLANGRLNGIDVRMPNRSFLIWCE